MPRVASDGNASVRAVLDTNTIVSGLPWRGPPRQLLDAARETRITLYSSAALVAELAEVIARERDAVSEFSDGQIDTDPASAAGSPVNAGALRTRPSAPA